MRTNIVLDDALVKRAFKHSKATTKRELVDEALRELLKNRTRPKLADLRGKEQLDATYDYKKMRG